MIWDSCYVIVIETWNGSCIYWCIYMHIKLDKLTCVIYCIYHLLWLIHTSSHIILIKQYVIWKEYLTAIWTGQWFHYITPDTSCQFSVMLVCALSPLQMLWELLIPATLTADIGRSSVWSNQCNGLNRLQPNWIESGRNLGAYWIV